MARVNMRAMAMVRAMVRVRVRARVRVKAMARGMAMVMARGMAMAMARGMAMAKTIRVAMATVTWGMTYFNMDKWTILLTTASSKITWTGTNLDSVVMVSLIFQLTYLLMLLNY